MIVEGIEILDQNWGSKLKEVNVILSQYEDFTSPTYQLRGLKSINGNWVLIKPIQPHFIEALNIKWVDVELMVNDEL